MKTRGSLRFAAAEQALSVIATVLIRRSLAVEALPGVG
jgi:hypothetical protein